MSSRAAFVKRSMGREIPKVRAYAKARATVLSKAEIHRIDDDENIPEMVGISTIISMIGKTRQILEVVENGRLLTRQEKRKFGYLISSATELTIVWGHSGVRMSATVEGVQDATTSSELAHTFERILKKPQLALQQVHSKFVEVMSDVETFRQSNYYHLIQRVGTSAGVSLRVESGLIPAFETTIKRLWPTKMADLQLRKIQGLLLLCNTFEADQKQHFQDQEKAMTCEGCRLRKIGCTPPSGYPEWPCSPCVKLGLKCTFLPADQQPLPPGSESQIKEYAPEIDTNELRDQENILKLRKYVLGNKHPSIIKSMVNLAAKYYRSGQLGKSVRVLIEDVFGDEHPMGILVELASLLRHQGKHETATDMLSLSDMVQSSHDATSKLISSISEDSKPTSIEDVESGWPLTIVDKIRALNTLALWDEKLAIDRTDALHSLDTTRVTHTPRSQVLLMLIEAVLEELLSRGFKRRELESGTFEGHLQHLILTFYFELGSETDNPLKRRILDIIRSEKRWIAHKIWRCFGHKAPVAHLKVELLNLEVDRPVLEEYLQDMDHDRITATHIAVDTTAMNSGTSAFSNPQLDHPSLESRLSGKASTRAADKSARDERSILNQEPGDSHYLLSDQARAFLVEGRPFRNLVDNLCKFVSAHPPKDIGRRKSYVDLIDVYRLLSRISNQRKYVKYSLGVLMFSLAVWGFLATLPTEYHASREPGEHRTSSTYVKFESDMGSISSVCLALITLTHLRFGHGMSRQTMVLRCTQAFNGFLAKFRFLQRVVSTIPVANKLFSKTPLPPGITRLEWTCVCSHQSFDDYTTPMNGVLRLAQRMESGSGIAKANVTTLRPSFFTELGRHVKNTIIAISRWRPGQNSVYNASSIFAIAKVSILSWIVVAACLFTGNSMPTVLLVTDLVVLMVSLVLLAKAERTIDRDTLAQENTNITSARMSTDSNSQNSQVEGTSGSLSSRSGIDKGKNIGLGAKVNVQRKITHDSYPSRDGTEVMRKFIHLCFHATPGLPTLKHMQLVPAVDPPEINCDQELFRSIRRLHMAERKSWIAVKLQGIHFVEFQVWPKRLVDNILANRLPPKTEEDYEYTHQEESALPSSQRMTHLYRYPEDASDDSLCLETFPKKKRDYISWTRGRRNVGWGIYLEEEPNKMFFMLIKGSTTVSIGLIFGICWNVLNGDDQKGFPWAVTNWVMIVLYMAFDVCEGWVGENYLGLVGKERGVEKVVRVG